MQFLLDVVGVVGPSQAVVYDVYNMDYYNMSFQLENLSNGDVDVKGQESADGINWTDIAGSTVTIPSSNPASADPNMFGNTAKGGAVTISMVTKEKNFRLVVNRSSGSAAVGLVKGVRIVPDWYAAKLDNSAVGQFPFQACATSCQDDCELKTQVTCQSLCELVAQT